MRPRDWLPVERAQVVQRYGNLFQGRWHWGVDLGGAPGTPVYAPEAMTIENVWYDNNTPPWVGYGPGGLVGRSEGTSGYHLLAHLDPRHLPNEGVVYGAGQQVGVMSSLGHVHWEIRTEKVDTPGTRNANTVDPMEWAGVGDTPTGVGWWAAILGLWWLSR